MAELRDAGFRLPIIANGGIRDFDDCREYFWAGADAGQLGSSVWLQPMPLYALGPLEGLRIRRLISRVARFTPPDAAPHWTPPTDGAAEPLSAEPASPVPAEPMLVPPVLASGGDISTARRPADLA